MSRSLSQEIIFGSLEGVTRLIKAGASVHEKDIYGFTPLIEATLKNDLSIAELLLAHGAKVDQEDISGQTALQWAVNRGALSFCKLYLNHGASPNHYSADGQPLLVNPLLRDQSTLIELLVSSGAEIQFAEDYIQAKLLGHRYELWGKAPILSPKKAFIEIDFEGFYLEFTVGLIFKTLFQYVQSKEGLVFRSYQTAMHKILRTLKSASELIPYKYKAQVPSELEPQIRQSLQEDLVLVPVAYQGHAITFIRYKNLWAKCDRGVQAPVDTVTVYQVGNPYALSSEFLKKLTFESHSDAFIHTEINQLLNLTPIATLPLRPQLSGNCSWANVEASIPAMMFMLMYRGHLQPKTEASLLKKSIMKYYEAWIAWDKDRVFSEMLHAFKGASREKRAGIASMLAAILLQRCQTNHPVELQRAKQILSILTHPDYKYILKTYIKVYYTQVAGATGEHFRALLKKCGVDPRL